MIFYYSGTGNSKFIAKEIAKLTNDVCKDIEENEIYNIDKEEQIGFVFPVYSFGVPDIVKDFAKNLKKTSKYTFGVCTCSSKAGTAMKKFEKIYKLNSAFSVIMPENFVMMYEVESFDIILEKIANAKIVAKEIAEAVNTRRSTYKVKEGKLIKNLANPINFIFNNFYRSTKKFSVNENCISCAHCESNCPSKSITLNLGKPTWHGTCYMCTRCINNCPMKAINYGKKTEQRKRYQLRNYIDEREL